MIKLKNILTEETIVVSKSDVKKMEKLSDKIIKDSETLLKMFKQKHKVSTKDSVLYNNSKEWEQAIRNLKMKFGGWFGFVYDSDYVK
jgi:DNA polymerase III gamma/tau subunit